MLGGNNSSSLPPVFMNENHMRYHTNASNQLQLFGNLPAGCGVDPVNYVGNERTPLCLPRKQARETEDPQNLRISLNYNLSEDEGYRCGSIVNQTPVSTGLQLSFNEDRHNSSVPAENGGMAAAQSILLSIGDNMQTVLNRHSKEFDEFIRIQEEQLVKGIREMKQRHVASIIAAIEEELGRKLQEKDLQIEMLKQRNKGLLEMVHRLATEALQWQHRAQHNEAIVTMLKTNLQQVMMSHGSIQPKEGFGENEIDDTASYADANHLHGPDEPSRPNCLRCRACKKKEVSFLLMPCKHLCLCEKCNAEVNVCPVCHLVRTASLQVLL